MSWLSLRTRPVLHRALCLLAAMLPIALVTPMTADAQDRLPPIPAAQLTDLQKQAMSEFAAARGGEVSYTLLAIVLNTARTPVPAGRAPGMPPFTR